MMKKPMLFCTGMSAGTIFSGIAGFAGTDAVDFVCCVIAAGAMIVAGAFLDEHERQCQEKAKTSEPRLKSEWNWKQCTLPRRK